MNEIMQMCVIIGVFLFCALAFPFKMMFRCWRRRGWMCEQKIVEPLSGVFDHIADSPFSIVYVSRARKLYLEQQSKASARDAV